ncbi:hypothetical protein [Candidatus Odyssella thessalonicensis]|uniref:hypothetical protein n=1 Tax=Candidatus Odyssella thessalonicensis TaxID=84647 RepID=UPI000225A980|nr:hypothetical protein [Candidatus Odyssella thessalonicensis]
MKLIISALYFFISVSAGAAMELASSPRPPITCTGWKERFVRNQKFVYVNYNSDTIEEIAGSYIYDNQPRVTLLISLKTYAFTDKWEPQLYTQLKTLCENYNKPCIDEIILHRGDNEKYITQVLHFIDCHHPFPDAMAVQICQFMGILSPFQCHQAFSIADKWFQEMNHNYFNYYRLILEKETDKDNQSALEQQFLSHQITHVLHKISQCPDFSLDQKNELIHSLAITCEAHYGLSHFMTAAFYQTLRGNSPNNSVIKKKLDQLSLIKKSLHAESNKQSAELA